MHPGNAKALQSYETLAARGGARLGSIAGQVQAESAGAASVADGQLVFGNQPATLVAQMGRRLRGVLSRSLLNEAESRSGRPSRLLAGRRQGLALMLAFRPQKTVQFAPRPTPRSLGKVF